MTVEAPELSEDSPFLANLDGFGYYRSEPGQLTSCSIIIIIVIIIIIIIILVIIIFIVVWENDFHPQGELRL